MVAGRLAGATDNAAAGDTVTEYACDPVAPSVSVAVIVKLNVAALVGVPVMAPVVALRARPAGKLPAVTANVDAPVPPVTVIDWLYAAPTVGAGSDAGFTVSGALTITEYPCDAVAPTVSVAVIVKLNVPAADDVPLIAPLITFNVNPVGNAPADTL